MEENVTPIPVAEPVAEQPKKKKTGKLLAILIPVIAVLIAAGVFAGILIAKNSKYKKAIQYLDDGDIAEAIEIYEQLGDYKDLASEICDTAASRCKKLLTKGDYAKVYKLYKTVKEYPEAIEGMNKKVKDHVDALLEERNYYTVRDLWETFAEDETQQAAIMGQIRVSVDDHVVVLMEDRAYYTVLQLLDVFAEDEDMKAKIAEHMNAGVDDMWNDSEYTAMDIYWNLREEGIYLEAMDQKIVEMVRNYLAQDWYWDAAGYLNAISHNAQAKQEALDAFVNRAKESMESADYWKVDSIYSAMYNYELNLDALNAAVYEGACGMMENGRHDEAESYFYLILNYAGEYEDCRQKIEEIEFLSVLDDMHRYMEYGWYSDAKYLINEYTGEKQAQLLEIFMQYSGDRTFIADLEAGLLARLAASDAGATEKELIEIEWGYLDKYWNLPFYDSRLQELAREYMYALESQEEAARYYYDYNYYDNYEFAYYWNIAAADRYAILDLLHTEYGYGNSDSRLQQVLGTSETLRQQSTAVYLIYDCLSYYLWGNSPYEENGVYYLYVSNWTEYTFSMTVYQQFCDYSGNTLGEHQAEYVSLQPNEWYQIEIAFPAEYLEYGDHWYIDWVISDIYQDGVLIYE